MEYALVLKEDPSKDLAEIRRSFSGENPQNFSMSSKQARQSYAEFLLF